MVSIDRLVTIYNNFGDRENLSPLGSADEEIMWNSKLTPKQVNWLERFIITLGTEKNCPHWEVQMKS